jgi:hypothetical protein
MNEKGESPFTPGSPVPVELFVGRLNQIDEILRYINQSLSGKQQNIFLTGDRGIGKTSMASFLRFLAESRKSFLGIHVFLGGVNTVEGMVYNVFDQLLKESRKKSWFNKISDLFGKYIKDIGLFGISVSFDIPKDDLKELKRNFSESLNNFLIKLKKENINGLFIALDDINGLADKKEFANWYKSFVDEVATKYDYLPLFIMLIGLPDKRDSLSRLQPSLMRIFRVVEIENLLDDEVRDFLSKAFSEANIEVSEQALGLMVQYSSGLPILMHEIGDATFWVDTDDYIDDQDAILGIIEAAERIGKKYLNPKVYNTLRSERYRAILRKLGDLQSVYFTKKEIEEKLNKNEKKVFDNVLRKMRDLGVITQDIEGGRGAYKFINNLYPIYIKIESKKSKYKIN